MEFGYVKFKDDDKYRVVVVGLQQQQDLALLKVTDVIKKKKVAPLARQAPSTGTRIWVIGYGAETEDIVSSGVVSKDNIQSKLTPETHCVLIDASIYDGSSGGGVFNVNGSLVGVLIQNGPNHPTMGLWAYAVHLDEITKFLRGYIK